MKFEIMLAILFELMSKKCVKASYLADKYEVSVRSIHRYINGLENAGIPIYTMRGNQGGFAIIDTFKFASTFFSKSEYEQIISSLSAITSSVPNSVLSNAINKLISSNRNEYSGFDIKSGNLIIDAGPWGDTVGYKSKLVVIQNGIENCKKLAIKYHDRNGDITERIIEPHVIVFKQGLWYVYAFCHLRKEFRFFKTGRIEHATILNEKFIRRDFSEQDLPFNFWYNSVEAREITLKISKDCLSDVEEWLGIENVSKRNNGYYATVNLPFDKGLASKIMSFGSGIEVVSPEELKTEIIKQAKEILSTYN